MTKSDFMWEFGPALYGSTLGLAVGSILLAGFYFFP
jgi:hypothetical protein